MGRDRHDGTGSIGHEDVIGYPDGNLLPVYWIDGVGSGEDACFLLGQLRSQEVTF